MNDSQGSLFSDRTLLTRPNQASLYAELVFDRPLDHVYSYAVPESLFESIEVGKRVLAPFGRGDRTTIGFCVGLQETGPDREVKSVTKVLDEEALLSPNMLRLTRWMADYYLCAWGQVLNAVIPSGAKQNAGTRTVAMLEAVPADELPDPLPKLTAKQQAALDVLQSQNNPIELRELRKKANCGPAPVQVLVDKGFAKRTKQRVETFHPDNARDTDDRPPTLNPDQQQAWTTLEPAVRQGGFHPFLLYGVTGSGKTELYLKAIEEVVRQGKQALVLVPEISLTPQTIARFRGRCGEVSVLHSSLQTAERGGHWRRIASGEVQVAVGARSAVFAPSKNLGLIVIDEEHESSFKEEATPRYQARDVAVMRARLEDIPIILGSATPSLESWHNAQKGQYTLLTLPRRVAERPMPQVSLIDLRHDLQPSQRFHTISPTLERSMHQALESRGQVMLLLNRRGFSTHIHCPSCGYVEQCRFCDLAMTYHKERGILLCHYCGFERKPIDFCPNCGQTQVRYQGLGTEKLLGEICSKFPAYVVERMDSDTMRRPGSHAKLLERFRQGEVHILLGTQMIAKGLDFPNVTLVGVINADMGLHRPDFRAGERTFQLIAQVSGRTGRGVKGGRVWVQSFCPEHPSILRASKHDFLNFASAELQQRREHGYPPFERLARIIIRSRDEQAAGDHADKLAGAFRIALEKLTSVEASVRVLGPAEASVFRLKGYFRFHFQLQSTSSGLLHEVLRNVLPAVRVPKNVEVNVDVDPYDMM